jgi:hypothetical protein
MKLDEEDIHAITEAVWQKLRKDIRYIVWMAWIIFAIVAWINLPIIFSQIRNAF